MGGVAWELLALACGGLGFLTYLAKELPHKLYITVVCFVGHRMKKGNPQLGSIRTPRQQAPLSTLPLLGSPLNQ